VSSPGRARTDHTRCLDDDRHALRTRSAFGSFAKPNNAEFSTTRRAASAVDAPSAQRVYPARRLLDRRSAKPSQNFVRDDETHAQARSAARGRGGFRQGTRGRNRG
jgi:hypothetical protein